MIGRKMAIQVAGDRVERRGEDAGDGLGSKGGPRARYCGGSNGVPALRPDAMLCLTM